MNKRKVDFMINVGVIGCGYWGPNLIRNFNSCSKVNLKWVCDLDKDRLSKIINQYPHVNHTIDYNELLKDESLDAIAIATPVNTHFNLAKSALENNKHVLLEKPIASNSKEAIELIQIANNKKLSLMCDHTYCYSNHVKKIKELIDNKTLGKILYFDSVRINLGLFQQDINVAWDLAPHDLSILFYIFNDDPISLTATGTSHAGNNIENLSYINLYYPNNMIAHIHVNWLSPLKERKIMIAGDKKMLVWDDLNPSESIKVYDTGIGVKEISKDEKRKFMISYRTGDVYIPKIEHSEPLANVVNEFSDSILGKKISKTDGKAGLKVLKVLEAINYSMQNNSKIVNLDFSK